jgi:hypothetical protein
MFGSVDINNYFFKMIYNHLFNLTHHTDYRLGVILNVNPKQVTQYRKTKTINYERLKSFMIKLEIYKFEYENLKIEL